MQWKQKVRYLGILFLLFPLASIAASFDHDLFWGMINDGDVKRLQEFLRDQGLYPESITGNFSASTKEAVKKFQKREKISPAYGFFGSKTRARLNSFLSYTNTISREEQIAILVAQIKELQEKLKELQQLQAKELQSKETASVAASSTSTPLIFTKHFQIFEQGFLDSPFLFGAHYPYKVRFDWATNNINNIQDSVLCSPPIKKSSGTGKGALYFPESNTSYSCAVTAKDGTGNSTNESVTFTTPTWIGVNGFREEPFPVSAITPLKVGDFTIYNGTTTDVSFAQIVIKVTDNMNSTLNRNREVKLVLRNGTSFEYDVLDSAKFTFNSLIPDPNAPHRYLVNLSLPVTIAKGSEKSFGLWIEGLEYVNSGLLSFELYKFLITNPVNTVGGFNLRFTKAPSDTAFIASPLLQK